MDSATRPARRTQSHGRPPWWLLLPAFAAAGIAVLPIWYLLVRAGSPVAVAQDLLTGSTARLVARSVLLTVTVTALAAVVAVVAAWLVTRTDLAGRRLWQVGLVLPLAVPSYISAFAWLALAPGLAGFPGAVLVLTLTTFPYVFLPTVAALSRIDVAAEEVAAALGRSRLGILWSVTLPQVRTSIAAGSLLVALYVLSDFGAVAAMRYEVFTWVIYGAYRSGFDPTRAAALSLLLVALAALLVLAEARARGRAAAQLGTRPAGSARPVALRRAALPASIGMFGVLAASLGVPLVVIGYWLAAAGREELNLQDILTALAATLRLSTLSALACIALAVPVGVLAARYRGARVAFLERTTYIGHALPGIVVAIAMVYVGVRLLRPIYQQWPLLVLAYVVLFLPLAVGTVRAAVENSPLRAEEVARSLGLTRWATLRRVTLPLAAPGIAAGAALVLLTTMKELPATLLLHPTGTHTLATMLWRYLLVSDYSAAAPYAALILLGAALPALALSRAGRLGGVGDH